MNLQQLFSVLRVRWRFIVVVMLLGSLASVALALSKPPTYESTGRIFIVAPNDSRGNAFSTLLITQRASSYADLAKDPTVLQKVRDRTQMDISTSELRKRITAAVVVDTQILRITATGASPEEAKLLTDAVVQQLLSLVRRLERPTGDNEATIVARTAGRSSLDRTPIGTRPWLAVTLGVLLSALVGFMGAVLRDMLDLTIKSRADAEAVAGAPLISALPLDSAVAHDQRGQVKQGSPLAEAFRVLRANLKFADLDASGQMILVTSALPDEGKTLTAVNLAQSLVATGRSVLLIDCDFRSPNVAVNLGLENTVGMLSVLLDQVTLSGAIQVHSSGLDVLGTGPTPPNPAEVLETDAVANLLSLVRETYDVIVIDAPPILPVADASTLIRHVDGLLLLARYGRTRKDALGLASERIESHGGRLYGVVLNGVPARGEDGYGYGYGYGYGEPYEGLEVKGQRPAGGRRRRVGEDLKASRGALR